MRSKGGVGTESPFFFVNEGCRLFGIHHAASGGSKGRGIVMCYPFAEERLWAHRVLVTFARILSETGYPVLRFDYRGNGDSEGVFETSTVETNVSDILSAVRWMRDEVSGVRNVDLVGLRFGATLASLAAERLHDPCRLVLWEPVLRGAAYMQELLRINLLTQTAVYNRILRDRKRLVELLQEGKTVNVDGYELSLSMFEQVSAVDLETGSVRKSTPCFIAQIDDRPKDLRAGYRNLAARYANAQLAAVVEEPFWKEIKAFYGSAPNLFAETLKWIVKE